VWIGDDDPASVREIVESHIRTLVQAGTRICFMHGNRDFLIEQQFAQRTGCELIADPVCIDLYGVTTVLTHGDQLCTDDVDHQTYRAVAYTDRWKRQLLEKPLSERIALVQEYRRISSAGKTHKSEQIMDVTQAAVNDLMRQFQARRVIHGHTHRPAVHRFELDGDPAERFVLAQWDAAGSVLSWTASGYRVETVGDSVRSGKTVITR